MAYIHSYQILLISQTNLVPCYTQPGMKVGLFLSLVRETSHHSLACLAGLTLYSRVDRSHHLPMLPNEAVQRSIGIASGVFPHQMLDFDPGKK